MTLDFRPLDAALARLEASLGAVSPAAINVGSDADAEARERSSELVARLRLPNLTVDPNALEGVQAALALFDRLECFPGEMQKTQNDVIARIGAFDDAVGRIAALSEACEEMLERRQAVLGELREAVSSLAGQLGDDMERLVSDAGEKFTESFTERLTVAGEQAFAEIRDLFDKKFADCGNLAAESAYKLESQAREITDGFVGKGQGVMHDVVEARARQLVEAQLAEVIEDLALSETISVATQQLNTAIASAAPNIVIALKAVSGVQKLLELAKL